MVSALSASAVNGTLILMDVVLITLGVLGLGAILISTYVFTVAARNYVSDDHRRPRARFSDEKQPLERVPRNPIDRRSGRPVTFPLTVNSILITNDRRTSADRRQMT
jgi:hypothetical protein